MLVLKRLSEAKAAGDRIWGVVRGSAVNQDGERPGLPAPRAATQARVIEEALSQAGVPPSQVDYLEAHGTGTRLGDPTEMAAAASVYGKGREDGRPLLVGSVKTNIGHLAAAAGAAGLIKVMLAMHRRAIPKHLNFRNPNPEIDWNGMPIKVTATPTEWPPASGRGPLAGVSSFGFSGTNAHVVVEGCDKPADPAGTGAMGWPTGAAVKVRPALPSIYGDCEASASEIRPREARILPLSGKSDNALRELADRYLSWLDEEGVRACADKPGNGSRLADMAWTASVGRSHFGHRDAIEFRGPGCLRAGLQALSERTGEAATIAPAKVAFAFTGQASQWVGMGQDLYETEPVVRVVLDRCDSVLREDRKGSLLDVMFGRPGAAGDLDDPEWKQPAIYALECALAALWSSIGIRPDVVFGHSLGEIAAAHAASAFSLEDGLRFAAARGALIGALPGEGAMAAVFAPAAKIAAALDEHNAGLRETGLCIAADNGAHQVVSGPAAQVSAIQERLDARGIRVTRLRRSPAYHSAMIEPALDDLDAALSTISFSPPKLALVSNLTGRLVGKDQSLDAAYWRRQTREPVAFRACVETLAEIGVDAIVEIGPHAVLGPMAALNWPSTVRGESDAPLTLASLRRPSESSPEPSGGDAFRAAVASAYRAGLPVELEGLFAGEERRRIPLPGYPFQRERHWVDPPTGRLRRQAGHPLLGVRRESPRGEVTFETAIHSADPVWVKDHLVFGQVVVPGAMFATMAATVLWGERVGPVVLDDCQLHSPMIVRRPEAQDEEEEDGRKLQIVFEGSSGPSPRRFEVFSRGSADGWTLHLDGRMSLGEHRPESAQRVDLERLKADLAPGDVASLYRNKVSTRVVLGPAFRPIQAIWAGAGEAVSEVRLPDFLDGSGLDLHPILLDGCFQTVLAARDQARVAGKATYMPFGWDRLWLLGPPPDRIHCHVRMRETHPRGESQRATDDPPEVVKADLLIYGPTGEPVGGVDGFTMKRATRAAMLSASAAIKDSMYEIAWRERPLTGGDRTARFLQDSEQLRTEVGSFPDWLEAEGVEPQERVDLLGDLDLLGGAYVISAFDRMGWWRRAGEVVDPEALCRRLNVAAQHRRLFARLLGILAESGVLKREPDGGLVVVVGSEERPPDEAAGEPKRLSDRLLDLHPHGQYEIGLLERCGNSLAEVLQGKIDPLSLLFGGDGPDATDYYRSAPAARAANRMLAQAVRAVAADLPEGQQLRVLEIGAGTGSATEPILEELPSGRFEYVFTDISAAFFADAESRFSAKDVRIAFHALDIEADPVSQGFDSHGYDLVIAANVIHATRDLGETLANCQALLAPSGRLVALELVRGRHLQDLTFGMLDGWWRFEDAYRSNHALATPETWRSALSDAGFEDTDLLGVDGFDGGRPLGPGIIVARGPEEVTFPPGSWILAPDHEGVSESLAKILAARNQTVVIADESGKTGEIPANRPGVFRVAVDADRRESWCSLLSGLPKDAPLQGIVHLRALDGHGVSATTDQVANDVTQAGASALSLVQGALDAGVSPANGLSFVTRGAQVLEREPDGELAGAALWGFGKALAREAAHLRPRMIDLDPDATEVVSDVADELLFPDSENHVVFRHGARNVARLVPAGTRTARVALPDEQGWRLAPDEAGALDGLRVESTLSRPLESGEVRVEIEASGLNFRDVLRATGTLDTGLLGREMCGRVVETGVGVEHVSAGDRVVGLAFGTFGPEVVTAAELVVSAPERMSAEALATVPVAFTTAALAFELAGLKSGERVLIHSGAGGVGLAAIQLAHAAGAEVIATASRPKHAYLRSLGVSQVFDSRETAYGKEILQATSGAGVEVVLNSLTGPGFVEASLECLAPAGRFVELGARGIWSESAMSVARTDVEYSILRLDALKESDPSRPGAALKRVMARMDEGELSPLPNTSWPLAEASRAMAFMRSARHVGKLVLKMPPLLRGRLRTDRTYLVTGGLGGIGRAVAGWLADRGAGAIVLNGRRPPDPAAEDTIRALREAGAKVKVEIADLTDAVAVDAMLARIDSALPPLAGVIHSVGVLHDGSVANQDWNRFERVLWPKVLGAWQLHRATEAHDLDMFLLFSSVVGVLGSAGQTNHASANAFLDQLAAHRRARGLPGQSIAWGAWSELGEAEEQRDRIADGMASRGARWITPELGLRALDHILSQDLTGCAVTSVDWPTYAESFATRPSLLEDLLTEPEEEPESAPTGPQDALIHRLWNVHAKEREELLLSFVQEELQAALRLTALPPPTARFFDLGVDSLMAVELRNRLNQAFAGEYVAPNTIVFDYPDATSLAGFLAEALGEALQGKEPTFAPQAITREPEARPAGKDGRIAIVGMACRFPGAPDVATYWDRLAAGADSVSDGRPGPADWKDLVGDPNAELAACRRGGFVSGIDEFDAAFFGIRPIEAYTLDPQQRMLLETSWHALEDAGIDPDSLRGSRTGVYVGISGSEYRNVLAQNGADTALLGTMGSVAASRVAFTLGLMGPAMPVDMTCAGSLAAVHEAVTALQHGEVDLALAGGVSAMLSPSVARFMVEMGLVSRNGTCRAFDAAADGHVRGEGCGIVVLKRLEEAEAEGEPVWGVIRGSAVNQNGPSAGLTIPNGRAQEQVIEDALAGAGVAPADVDYLEAHGTGSQIGDPIEVHAAAAAYGKGREAGHPLLIGTVKASIGHLEAAAGMAGLIKVVLAMRNGTIPRQLHFATPNPHVDWDRLPIRVASEPTDWPMHADRPARASVSAFGVSGTNAHVIVEGCEPRDIRLAPAGAPTPVAVALPEAFPEPLFDRDACRPRRMRTLPLSGKSANAVRSLAGKYLSWLDQGDDALAPDAAAATPLLSDMAWTAGTGRSHLAWRSGVVFTDAASLREGLNAIAQGDVAPQPGGTPKVAFVYPGPGGAWAALGESLYEAEPVVRAVLDRCEAVISAERGTSLRDRMFGHSDPLDDPDDPAWARPAAYAMQCALTALWSSVGIEASAVVGIDIGELAAAEAAGMIGLEDGLLLAAAGSASTGRLPEDTALAPPARAVISGITGKEIQRDGVPDFQESIGRERQAPALQRIARTLSHRGIGVIVEMGAGSSLGTEIAGAWPDKPRNEGVPTVIETLRHPSGGDAFAEAVTQAFEAGMATRFAGLFAGEVRRRISLPGYPFERMRYWVDNPRQ
ncbi:MAG: SDR family NAD(P)-dependent oxidoreductase [Boseongicola sp.]|nr:SDR family NAD(P)-dependent oxidoreductase [Boseongicola sp.]